MKKNIYILLFIAISCFATAQDKIDPNNLFVPGTVFQEFKNDHFVSKPNMFIRGWNWGKPGAAIDSAMGINFLHGAGLESPDYIHGTTVAHKSELFGRVKDRLLNGNAYYYNPCIIVDSTAYFTPGADHQNGSVFGFKNKYLGTVNNHAFCLSKSSVSSPTLVLDGLWTDEPIHFINHITWYNGDTCNMTLANKYKQNGYNVYLTINLQCPDTIPDNLLDSTVLTLTVPYEKWHYTYVINGSDTVLTSSVPTIIPGLLAKFSRLPQATSSIADDTLAMISSYDPTDYRGVERKMVDSTPTTTTRNEDEIPASRE